MVDSKNDLLVKMNSSTLKALNVIANSQGITVKELCPILDCVNSTVNNLLSELCDLNCLVRERQGKYGSYLYYLHPSIDPDIIKWALEKPAQTSTDISDQDYTTLESSVKDDSMEVDTSACESVNTERSRGVENLDWASVFSDLKTRMEKVIVEQQKLCQELNQLEFMINRFDSDCTN